MTTVDTTTSAQATPTAPAGQTTNASTLLGGDAKLVVDTTKSAATTGTIVDGAKSADAKVPEAKGKEGESKVESAPETYTTFTVPEGLAIEPAMLGKFSTAMKALNLTQEKAQSLIDLATEHSQSLIQAQAKAWQDIRQTWVSEIKDDKDFGGQKFGETLERAGRALTRFGTPAFKEFLQSSGYGDNPELIRLLAKVDKVVGEDRAVNGGASTKETSAAQVLYGSKQ